MQGSFHSGLRSIRDRLAYLVVRLFICFVQAITIESCQAVAKILAWIASEVVPIRRRVLEDNLTCAFPKATAEEKRRIVREMWEHLFLMVCEIAHVPRKIHETNWRRYVEVRNKSGIVGRLLDTRPTILVSGHFGNFELASYICALYGFPSYSIARRLDNPYLHEYVNRFRSRTGQYILPKDGSAAQIQAVLDSGGALALLGDQHAGPKGCWVDFFGRPASCHKALALFSLSSGGPLLVVSAFRNQRPMKFVIDLVGVSDPQLGGPESAGVKPLTQWYNRMLEIMIRGNPNQYWWLHRRWRDPPVKRTKSEIRDGELDSSSVTH